MPLNKQVVMYIKKFRIVNFKTFKDATIEFDPVLSILTGVNNSGKTTVLEAVALWLECFSKLIMQAGRGASNYKKGQYVLGNTQVKYFPFEQINSVRCPNFEDIFHNRERRERIELSATLTNGSQDIEIPFTITESGMNYKIELAGFSQYSFDTFNTFFSYLPDPIGFYYASPIAAISQIEDFSTSPKVAEAIINRSSSSVFRNRLYALYRHSNSSLFQQFLNDVNYVLSDNRQRMEITTLSDIQRDTRITFTVKLNPGDTEKDIALLGSGTLQIIEILLNLHHSDSRARDFNIILLDEPDSHIHRDIQSRLMQILTRFSTGNQILITTHNEALIRSANQTNLFHLSPRPGGTYKSIGSAQLPALNTPHFSGIFPATIRPIISELGSTNGLDFINAIEADALIFVEGEDDARAFDILLKQQTHPKKYAYWVLGGVSKVLENILHYKTVFSAIKNTRTLWEKSVLIIDRDFLNDTHQSQLPGLFNSRLHIKSFIAASYTFESTALTDLAKLARLLEKWLLAQSKSPSANLEQLLTQAYQAQGASKTSDWSGHTYIEQTCYLYRNAREKLKTITGQDFIHENDIQLQTLVRAHIQLIIDTNAYHKLMRKEDVEIIINQAISATGLVFNIETDFIGLIAHVDKSTWFPAWDFLNQI